MKGYIHSFESLAAVDGEGLRCAVFLSGCPLRCVYCHNPDTWEKNGTETESQDLAKKVARYKPYFKDNGGVTFSGGEPLCQAEFIAETALYLKEENINYAIDTSGAVMLTDTVKEVLKNAHLVILDLKFWDDESYIKYTGHSIENTLETLKYLNSIGKRTWIRTVVVPGINDTEEKLNLYIEHIKDMKCVEKYELLAFHTMGFHKYEKLGVNNPLLDTESLDEDKKQALQKYALQKLKEMQSCRLS